MCVALCRSIRESVCLKLTKNPWSQIGENDSYLRKYCGKLYQKKLHKFDRGTAERTEWYELLRFSTFERVLTANVKYSYFIIFMTSLFMHLVWPVIMGKTWLVDISLPSLLCTDFSSHWILHPHLSVTPLQSLRTKSCSYLMVNLMRKFNFDFLAKYSFSNFYKGIDLKEM